MEFITKSSEETITLGKKIGSLLKPNEVIALYGFLGSGKTTLTSGIACGLGVKGQITSPTFILINEFDGKIPIYHLDLYRIENISEIKDLGIDEYFNKGGVCVIEWPEKLRDLLPINAKKIKIEMLDETIRKISANFDI